ncbi:MAG TPA: peptidylprolyl isomerase [Bacteroidales bacterium]|nr:peptidylprolyl isomerase [Bacteroidales bacterium]
MAVIGYIRKHSAIAVFLVGISLVAFLVGPNLIDWARNVLGYSSGPGTKREVGIINGKSISLAEFEGLTLENVEQVKVNQQKADLTADEIFNIKDQTWTQRLNEEIMQAEYGKLGLTISPEEMIDQLRGNDPHRLIRQYFINDNGQYDPGLVVNYIQNLDRMTPRDRAQWENFKEYIYNDRLISKYNALIAKGYYLPKQLAQMEYHNTSDLMEVRYVAPKFVDISDSLAAESTEDQYKEYYEDVKHKFTQNSSRDIEFVVFNILPSDEDLAEIEAETKEVFKDWTYANDPGEYVNNIPGNRYDSSWYGPGELSVYIDSVMFAAEIGVFIEPYKEGPAWHMARLMDRQVRPDSASAEHILIAYQGAFRTDPNLARTKEEAELLADSVYNVIKNDPTRLPELALSMSDDGSANTNAGNIGWFKDGEMVYEFNKAAILGKTGDVVKIETPFGYHIVYVTGVSEPRTKVRVAQIEVPIEYSAKTYDEYYAVASRFAGENNTREKFDQAVIDQGLEKREATYIREMQLNLPTFENTRQIIRWVYWDDREVGDVSPLFDIGGQLVVAVYTGSREEGIVPYDIMRERLVNNLLNERKADYIIEKMKSIGTADLEAIARAFNTEVDTNKNLTFNARNFPGYGTEHNVIGRLFTFKEGDNTGIIKGNAGVFVCEVNKVFIAPDLDDYSSYVNQKVADFNQRVANNFPFQAMQKNAEIKDYRRYFY